MKSTFNNILYIIFSFLALIDMNGCKKLVEINPPINSITTEETFADSTDADAAIQGIYSQMINTNGNPNLTDGGVTIVGGLSSDELINFNTAGGVGQIYTNSLTSNNAFIYGNIWSPTYSIIYNANSCIEGLQESNGLSVSTKNRLINEAKFLRAFCYFYLINLFGDVPYITSTNFNQNAAATRSPTSQIYSQIISDLKSAQIYLPNDYTITNGLRIRATKWAATALLARIYLYNANYADASTQSSAIINNSLFTISSALDNVFLINSTEAILQLGLNPTTASYGNATTEGLAFIPYSNTSYPFFYLSPQLLDSFENGDQRRVYWVDSTVYNSVTYYYPYKYKIGNPNYSTGNAVEYYMIFRLAEQYLIRAEAEANSDNGGSSAIADLNVIRNRAGLPNYTGAPDKNSVLSAIMHERQIEFFDEWGNRWLDLKRTGEVNTIMSVITPKKTGGKTWQSYQQLYPIPISELKNDPKLTQNPGY